MARFYDPDEMEAARDDPTLATYAGQWLAGRTLKPRTVDAYRNLLDRHLLPQLGTVKLSRLTPVRVRAWYSALDASKATTRSHAYLLLHAICATAVDDELLVGNPCRIRGAGQVKAKHQTRVATLPELATLTEAMPPRFRAMVVLAAWCGLRYGELTELRRKDVDGAVVRVERGVVRSGGGFVIGDPKTAAGDAPWLCRRTWRRCWPTTWPATSALARTPCCSRPSTVATWPPARSTAPTTRRATRQAGQTSAFTICGTRAQRSPPRPAQRCAT